ncbi:MAG: Stp1/IreP family PP2C-type Ser/Thr phosphatase [Methanomassiliicoccales archaeon]
MRTCSITDTGKVRQDNQDRFLSDPTRGLFVVCDGMGGYQGGELAAQIAVETLEAAFADSDSNSDVNLMPRLAEALARANEAVWKRAQQEAELSEMGTTITVALIRSSHLYAAHVGDSPLFLLRDEGIMKLTNDHTLANKMITEGIITATDPACQQFSHILTRALGVEPMVNVDLLEMNLLPGDVLLLASDGLTKLVSDEEIRAYFCQPTDLELILNQLVNLSLDRGGGDNITVVAVALDDKQEVRAHG